MKDVFRLHGFPGKLVWGTVSMSKFWKSVCKKLSIFCAPSTAFHPRKEGQVERINNILEDYLRHFVGERQDDWFSWLSLDEFAFNNSVSSLTGFLPFFANLGYDPQFNSITLSSGILKADEFVIRMQQVQSDLEKTLACSKSRQSHFYDKGQRVDVEYKPGELVWLSRQFIRTRRPSHKSDFRRIGPFPVKCMIGKNAVKLVLPDEDSRLHPGFDVSLIMPYFCKVPLTMKGLLADEISDTDALRYLVDWVAIEMIVDHRVENTTHQYLLRASVQSGKEDDFWVPLQNI